MNQKISVKYSASGSSVDHSNYRETITLSVEIETLEDYENTLELLRCKVLEKLNLQEKHDKLVDEYKDTRRKFVQVTEQLEAAQKQWELVSNFLKVQGLKKDTAEFPTEALTSLSKSLPTTQSGYPE